jgi:hypothetical protein
MIASIDGGFRAAEGRPRYWRHSDGSAHSMTGAPARPQVASSVLPARCGRPVANPLSVPAGRSLSRTSALEAPASGRSNCASALQEGGKTASIHGSSGVIWRIPVKAVGIVVQVPARVRITAANACPYREFESHPFRQITMKSLIYSTLFRAIMYLTNTWWALAGPCLT